MYSDKVMDHFKNPRNVGVIENASAIGEAGALSCGDKLKLYLKIDNNKIYYRHPVISTDNNASYNGILEERIYTINNSKLKYEVINRYKIIDSAGQACF